MSKRFLSILFILFQLGYSPSSFAGRTEKPTTTESSPASSGPRSQKEDSNEAISASLSGSPARVSQLEPLAEEFDRLKIENRLHYTVNLVWINKHTSKWDETRPFVFPETHERTFLEQRIFEWARLSSGADVNVWFDGGAPGFEMVSEAQIQQTQQLFDRFNQENPHAGRVFLKNVRSIAQVQENEAVFSSETPVYFRADLLRVMATVDTLDKQRAVSVGSGAPSDSYFIYADFDVAPLSQEELFDPETLAHLGRFGMVVAQGGLSSGIVPMENAFHIVRGGQAHLMEALKTAIIETNIQRGKIALDGELHTRHYPHTSALPQIVYDSYPSMYRYLYHLEGLGSLQVKQYQLGPKEFDYRGREYQRVLGTFYVPYDKAVHGLSIFQPDSGSASLYSVGQFDAWDPKLIHQYALWVPTKVVKRPPSKNGGYN